MGAYAPFVFYFCVARQRLFSPFSSMSAWSGNTRRHLFRSYSHHPNVYTLSLGQIWKISPSTRSLTFVFRSLWRELPFLVGVIGTHFRCEGSPGLLGRRTNDGHILSGSQTGHGGFRPLPVITASRKRTNSSAARPIDRWRDSTINSRRFSSTRTAPACFLRPGEQTWNTGRMHSEHRQFSLTMHSLRISGWRRGANISSRSRQL